MEDFIESAKRAAGAAMERAAWETDKLRRVNDRQREIELLRRERMALVEQMVSTVRELERRGELTQPALKTVAERLRTLDDDIAGGQADVQKIRQESYTPGSVTVSVQRRDASTGAPDPVDRRPCPTCGRPMRLSATYCSACGARLR
jgi:DNA repair exonuclease SbcCD ATPase subunit